MSKEKTPTPLSVMLQSGGDLEVKGKIYTVRPLALKDIQDFMKDNLSLGPQLFSVNDDKSRKKVDKWLQGYCLDDKDAPLTLDKAMADDWDVVDLKEFIRKLCDLSG
ncbi:MAG TPA: hypothetical protein GX707_09840 [Epulopiscium sp.]|nr:hypothetical protein [Candidatus Epulonipiscium sp.]